MKTPHLRRAGQAVCLAALLLFLAVAACIELAGISADRSPAVQADSGLDGFPETSSSPGRHAGLALEPYSRITSPLRRYGDLLAHQQLRRVINGLKPFSAEYIDDRLAGR